MVASLTIKVADPCPWRSAVSTPVCGSIAAAAVFGALSTAPMNTASEPVQVCDTGHSTGTSRVPSCSTVGFSSTCSPGVRVAAGDWTVSESTRVLTSSVNQRPSALAHLPCAGSTPSIDQPVKPPSATVEAGALPEFPLMTIGTPSRLEVWKTPTWPLTIAIDLPESARNSDTQSVIISASVRSVSWLPLVGSGSSIGMWVNTSTPVIEGSSAASSSWARSILTWSK